MAFFRLPVRNDVAAYRFRVELDDEPFIFTFRYNPRHGRWFMDLQIAEGDVIFYSRAVVLNDDILKPFRGVQGAPNGPLIITDLSNENVEPDDNTFGDEVAVIFEETA